MFAKLNTDGSELIQVRVRVMEFVVKPQFENSERRDIRMWIYAQTSHEAEDLSIRKSAFFL